jgi:NIPSNAP
MLELSNQEERNAMAFYELRQYHVRPGRMNEWVKIMEEEIIPFQVAKGMVICGSFRGETDDSAYIWIRRFDSEAQREALYKAVYETDHWKTKIAPRVPECLDREKMVITRIVPTPRSTMQ